MKMLLTISGSDGRFQFLWLAVLTLLSPRERVWAEFHRQGKRVWFPGATVRDAYRIAKLGARYAWRQRVQVIAVRAPNGVDFDVVDFNPDGTR